MPQPTQDVKYQLDSGNSTAVLSLCGDWCFDAGIPQSEPLFADLSRQQKNSTLQINCEQLGKWDSGLMTFLLALLDTCRQHKIAVDTSQLPVGAQKLLDLATRVPERKGARRAVLGLPVLTRIGNVTIEMHRNWEDLLSFLGETVYAVGNMLRGKARFRTSDLFYQIEGAGPSALAIITLISTLVGLILAFVGAVQLRLFGAQIFIADLVGLGMAREMGAMMTAIIMAGRTGAAYAAQLGTMQVNEEIDALKTMGISPIEFLVLPRLMALCLMMPLLCIYADFMGIFGGAIVSALMLDISFFEYYQQLQSSVALKHFLIGLIKAAIFGVIVATSGCFRGMQCGRSASAVGFAATNAVVTSIVLIVVADAIVTIICQILGY
ncbi:phospholipid/cholesterol/gamma-HCH transport system permease protein [Malonomonas rubra DSM 5091]|uniref:Phospholipid/cholesterol/gamma-HCH transport system permease protein n=1 Tax=Malonomonas rubra DSM 5091 TaxID=1122189 RepID=A0A1M6LF74_MALRU|nr:MlaE family lipid ABC transporter permease subunit [Malonomonas rubra]SHJ69844.1 phospholipid/cholesterol/gamma-HCH transport system permease protein [Malonomonas rubra DSM 5091]